VRPWAARSAAGAGQRGFQRAELDRLGQVRVEAKTLTYQYGDAHHYYFMDNATYDQVALSADQLGDAVDFLTENLEVTIAFNGDDPVEVRVPQHLNMKIVKTDPGVRGDTATGGSKPATLETGVVVQVPLFVDEGETIRIDTRERRYIERVKAKLPRPAWTNPWVSCSNAE